MGRNKLEKKVGQATIFDVANAAGVSISTVSRVLNGTARVEPETRRRVEEAMRRLSFEPRAAARTLAGMRTRLLGLLVPEISGDFFVPLLRGIEAGARSAGYELLIRTTGDDPPARSGCSLGERDTDGLLLFADSLDPRLSESLAATGFPVVLLYSLPPDQAMRGGSMLSVTLENEGGAAEAVRHLIEIHGRRRIVCFTGPKDNNDALARLRGYHRAIEEAGLERDPRLEVPGDFSTEVAAASTRRLIGGGIPFDAILACDDEAALGAIVALGEAGIAPGEDVSVVGFDDQDFASRASTPIATVRAPTELVGTRAAELLIGLIEGREGLSSVVLPTSFVPRASCGCAPGPGRGFAAKRKGS